MTNDTLRRLKEKLLESPILRAATLPDSKEVDAASLEIGVPFAPDYREFLLKFGGAMVGPYPIFGLRPVKVMSDDHWSVVVVTRWYRADNVPGTEAWTVISNDHAGNPVGMDSGGAIWKHDHDFGGVSAIAKSFEDYVRVHCLGLRANN